MLLEYIPENIPPMAVTPIHIAAKAAVWSHSTNMTANRHAAGTTDAEISDAFLFPMLHCQVLFSV